MAMRIESGAEPIPGYRLIERLGGGGFGEVWKAEVPGGLFKAMKFVFGDLQGMDDDGSRAEQELKALLSRVKTVHHPYILSLERYDFPSSTASSSSSWSWRTALCGTASANVAWGAYPASRVTNSSTTCRRPAEGHWT